MAQKERDPSPSIGSARMREVRDDFVTVKAPKRRIRAKIDDTMTGSNGSGDDAGDSGSGSISISSSRAASTGLKPPRFQLMLDVPQGDSDGPAKKGSLTDRGARTAQFSDDVMAAVTALSPRTRDERVSALETLSPRELAELEKIGGQRLLRTAKDDSAVRTRARAMSGTYIDLMPVDGKRKRASTFTHSFNVLRGRRNTDNTGDADAAPSPAMKKKKKGRSSLGFIFNKKKSGPKSPVDDEDEVQLTAMVRQPASIHGAARLLESQPPQQLDRGAEGDTGKICGRGFGWALEAPSPEGKAKSDTPFPIEFGEYDSLFYQIHFMDYEHQTYLCTDKMLGPVFVSTRKHKKRGSVLMIIRSKKCDFKYEVPMGALKKGNMKQLIKDMANESGLHLTGNLRLVEKPELTGDLAAFEAAEIFHNYKIGVLLVKEGQVHDDEFFSNCDGSPQWYQFLDCIGCTVDLKGFDGFDGGLDTEKGSTGETSVIASHMDQYNIMYHVSTMLPFHEDDLQRVERKRHLGNDVVNIVFVDHCDHSFNPESVKTNFIHVYAVVAVDAESTARTGETHFRVEIAIQDGVPSFGPPLPDPPIFHHEDVGPFLRAKLINGERASYKGPAIRFKLQQTRKDMLRSYVEKYVQ